MASTSKCSFNLTTAKWPTIQNEHSISWCNTLPQFLLQHHYLKGDVDGLREPTLHCFMPNQHLQQCFFIYWGNKNLFSYQNFRNPCLYYSCRFLTTPLVFPCIIAICSTYHIWKFPSATPRIILASSTTYTCHFVSSEIRPLFSDKATYLFLTYGNKISTSLEIIKKFITQNTLLQTWRKSSW